MTIEKNKAAKLLGKLGGAARSEAKTAAAKSNGAKGGRPFRVELTEDQRDVIIELVTKRLSKLQKFLDDDPSWPRRWQQSIDESSRIAQKLKNLGDEQISLKKIELIHLVQLLASRIAQEEKGASEACSSKRLDTELMRYHTIARHLDSLICTEDQPSILEHYLKESRR